MVAICSVLIKVTVKIKSHRNKNYAFTYYIYHKDEFTEGFVNQSDLN
jgi:hypothetical protein